MEKKLSRVKMLGDQINEVEKRSGWKWVAALGVIGLLFYVIPGIALFIVAYCMKKSNDNRLQDLNRELDKIGYVMKESKK